jgi:hypothetical protein
MIKLDDCSILQRNHLVGSREDPESMTYSASTKSHNLKTLHAQVSGFGRATDEHLVHIGMGSKPDSYKRGLGTPLDSVQWESSIVQSDKLRLYITRPATLGKKLVRAKS